MAKRDLPSPELLRQLLRYEPETGRLFWKPRTSDQFASGKHPAAHTCAKWNSRHAGKAAFTADNGKGYLVGNVGGRSMLAHRVAFTIHTGSWPEHEVDHINGVRSDNRFSNLRGATSSENKMNRPVNATSSTGYKGVGFDKRSGTFTATIKRNGKKRHLGTFPTAEMARDCYLRAAATEFGSFAHVQCASLRAAGSAPGRDRSSACEPP